MCTAAQFTADYEKIIAEGGAIPLVVSGNSMNPFLVDGKDTVWLCAPDEKNTIKGSILLFRRESGVLVLHRVRKVLPDGVLIMNGDAQKWCEAVDFSQIVAAVSHTEKNGKKVSCNSPSYLFLCAVWRILMPVRPYLLTLWRKIKKITDKS